MDVIHGTIYYQKINYIYDASEKNWVITSFQDEEGNVQPYDVRWVPPIPTITDDGIITLKYRDKSVSGKNSVTLSLSYNELDAAYESYSQNFEPGDEIEVRSKEEFAREADWGFFDLTITVSAEYITDSE